MVHGIKARDKEKPGANKFSWKDLGSRLRSKRTLGKTAVDQKLDVAFRMEDVERIEQLGVCHSSKTKMFADSEWAPLTLVVHVKGREMPMLVTCAKPGHVDAWMEAFGACVASLKLESLVKNPAWPGEPIEISPPGLILGARDVEIKRKDRSSLAKWAGSAIDWG